ncbi:MAG: hypothetical protein H6828_00330 [Planctomycetes bacterium]|nr:hypothetical protein [Planctomycetota bacterium]
MDKRLVWKFGKLLEGIGLLVVLVGVVLSIQLGFEEEGLASMAQEFYGLAVGGALFGAGWLLERWAGAR